MSRSSSGHQHRANRRKAPGKNSDIAIASNGRTNAAFSAEIGRLVRLSHAKRGMTRRASSRRIPHLQDPRADRERRNPVDHRDALDRRSARSSDRRTAAGQQRPARPSSPASWTCWAGIPANEMSAIADFVERHIGAASAVDRARRIALVGLRGAGESTLGRLIAERFSVPFIDLRPHDGTGLQRQPAAADRGIWSSNVHRYETRQPGAGHCRGARDRRHRDRRRHCLPTQRPMPCCCGGPIRFGSARGPTSASTG